MSQSTERIIYFFRQAYCSLHRVKVMTSIRILGQSCYYKPPLLRAYSRNRNTDLPGTEVERTRASMGNSLTVIHRRLVLSQTRRRHPQRLRGSTGRVNGLDRLAAGQAPDRIGYVVVDHVGTS